MVKSVPVHLSIVHPRVRTVPRARLYASNSGGGGRAAERVEGEE